MGVFLKLHIMEKKVRPWVVPVHGFLGKAFPVIGWTREYMPHSRRTIAEQLAEMLFGIATALDLCRDGELGQCAAHYIMGSAFIGYAAILVIMLNLGGKWLDRKGVSQEMLDSWVIMLWVGPTSSLTQGRY